MRFYHQSTVIRRNQARTLALKINGEWISDPSLIIDHISNYFVDLFGRHKNNMNIDKAY